MQRPVPGDSQAAQSQSSTLTVSEVLTISEGSSTVIAGLNTGWGVAR